MAVTRYPFALQSVVTCRVHCFCFGPFSCCGRFLRCTAILLKFNALQNYSNCPRCTCWASDFIRSWTGSTRGNNRAHEFSDCSGVFGALLAIYYFKVMIFCGDVSTYASVWDEVICYYLRHAFSLSELIFVINLSESAEPWICLRRYYYYYWMVGLHPRHNPLLLQQTMLHLTYSYLLAGIGFCGRDKWEDGYSILPKL